MRPLSSLPENLAAFCALLRGHDFQIGPGELVDAVRALEVVTLGDERIVRDALRLVLSSRAADLAVFDRLFSEYFFDKPGTPQGADAASPEAVVARRTGGEAQASQSIDRRAPETEAAKRQAGLGESGEADDEDEAGSLRSAWSPLAGSSAGPDLGPAGEAWRDAARTLVRRVELGVSRRWRPARCGRRFDLRRTLRQSLHTGGEMLTPRWLARRRRRARFVVLVDGSRSMSVHAPAALQIAIALADATADVHVFTFSTALRQVTADVRAAADGRVQKLEGLDDAWGGGTTIGACLRAFVSRAGDRLLGRSTLVIVVSDGLDVGDPVALGHAMHDLRRRSAGIVWLNPLLASPGYEPVASGMHVALPHVTTFASGVSADDFARVARLVRVRG
jgi:uncharacterized protein with von Willebrand factor type A (vWA) domain